MGTQLVARRALLVGAALSLWMADEAAARKRGKRYRYKAAGAGASKERSPADAGGSCSCSGSRVCIGPRGRRYCITSGGKKRYGV